MAKMRVYELAKELDVSNKEIIDFLSGQKIEAKSHSSSLEDDAVSVVRNHFRKKEAAPAAAPETKSEGEETPDTEYGLIAHI